MPRMDVRETDKEIIIEAELPRLEEKDIPLTLQNGILTVDVTARARSGGTAPPRTRRRLWSGAIRMSESVHDGTAGRIFASVGLLSLILAGAVCLLPIMPPLQDFNEWIYQGFLLKTLWLGGAVPAVVKPWPVPNSAAQVILGLLNLGLDPYAAGIAYLMLYLGAFGWLAWRLAPNRASFLLAIILGVLSSPFWDGYANYQLGLVVLMTYLVVTRDRELPWYGQAAFAIALFFCHAVLLAVFAVLLGWRSLLRPSRIPSAVAALLPAFAMMVWYAAVDRTGHSEEIAWFVNTIPEFIAYKGYTLAKTGPYQNMVIDGISDSARAPALYWVGVGINFVFAVVAVTPIILFSAWRLVERRASAEVLTALTCFLIFAIAPSGLLFGIVNLGERFLLPGLLIALTAVDDRWQLRRFGAVLACAKPLTLLWMLAILPSVPHGLDIRPSEVLDASRRSALLFWHRPFQYRGAFFAAQEAARTGLPPTRKLGFMTSLLAPKP